MLTYKLLKIGQPEHQSVLLSGYTPPRQLRSSDRQLLSQPADNTVFASRAFSSTAPRIWNSLPFTIRTAPSSNTFRQHLKIHLFSTTSPSTNCYHPRLRFKPVLTYAALQMLTTYLVAYLLTYLIHFCYSV